MNSLQILAYCIERKRALDRMRGMQTSGLLWIRNGVYRTHGGRNPETEGPDWEQHAGYCLWDYGGWVSLAEIKAELATRPHVPNKAERRAARQAAGHREGRRRGRGDR